MLFFDINKSNYIAGVMRCENRTHPNRFRCATTYHCSLLCTRTCSGSHRVHFYWMTSCDEEKMAITKKKNVNSSSITNFTFTLFNFCIVFISYLFRLLIVYLCNAILCAGVAIFPLSSVYKFLCICHARFVSANNKTI